jgi:REP element-mobilizing transposase RayT
MQNRMEKSSHDLHRRSIRLPRFDYAQPNAYFITICTAGRRCLFGSIVGKEMHLNAFGKIVEEEWLRTIQIRREIVLDEYVVMPNHLHGIVVIQHDSGAEGDRRSPLRNSGPRRRSLGSFVGGFKASTTRRIKEIQRMSCSIWQRNYYEHIVRSEKSLDAIRAYIIGNPANWRTDRENPGGERQSAASDPWQV